jgi:hypothetical protein
MDVWNVNKFDSVLILSFDRGQEEGCYSHIAREVVLGAR